MPKEKEVRLQETQGLLLWTRTKPLATVFRIYSELDIRYVKLSLLSEFQQLVAGCLDIQLKKSLLINTGIGVGCTGKTVLTPSAKKGKGEKLRISP